MVDQTVPFQSFIQRIRAGDDQAAVELVRQYEPLIRTEIRLRLVDPSLCRVFDSMDICQSVLGSFFVRAAAGQYDLENPQQLVQLLIAITRNKLAGQARRQHRQRRDLRRMADVAVDELEVTARDQSPSQLAAGKELLEAFRARLNPEERQLAELRAADCEWQEIADRLGGTPQARRKQLARAIDRVSQELGLED